MKKLMLDFLFWLECKLAFKKRRKEARRRRRNANRFQPFEKF